MTGNQPPKWPRPEDQNIEKQEQSEDPSAPISIEIDVPFNLSDIQSHTSYQTSATMDDLPVVQGTVLPDPFAIEQQQEIGSQQIAYMLADVVNNQYGGSWESFSRQLDEAAKDCPTFQTIEQAFATVTSVSLPAATEEAEKPGIGINLRKPGIENFQSAPTENANISKHFVLPQNPSALQNRVNELTQPNQSGVKINFYEPNHTDPQNKELHYEFCIVAMIFTAYTEQIVSDNIEDAIPFAAAVDTYNSIARASFDHRLFAKVWNQVVNQYSAKLES